ncbi:cytochrome c biogenesis protein CcdA [Streptomyces sp. MBT67]|uniref:cytochrome c biogenesis CcdA family protein n=1 Tax=unclassified Streptomyces TaxID=2593676 RepID=UPI000BEF9D78|nr:MULTISPECIES: cytochrome c biogenesis CcdA family protein [unclassified Streptomyces]MBK3528271.1 cytochrome c biogenesis protein CcdA [Streptomyces sp. MBT72]MBK3535538.1 cytochrome c biogenesis protein CcdA [Streptomyces sp. MBT67]MBK3549298.1 cytochrome c biogenesis protein CcdA [Streptomyces sp. MBT61]MBK6028233.1 cytochrome c biogenesis protein CcdA [Streptomyces sp. MBT59]
MTADIGYFAAFLGGLLALVSPCSALLLPAFFAYSIDSTSRLLARTGIFYAGLATTLVPLGAAGSYAGRLFYGHRDALVTGAGWLIIVLGVAQIVGLGFASRRMAELSGRIRPTTAFSVYALGAVYGLAGFCAGPILGSVLTVAAVSGSPVYGGLLLAVYALGMAVPLFVLALLWERFDLGRRTWLRGRTVQLGGRFQLHTTSLLSGLFFIGLGALFLVYDGTTALPGLLGVDDSFAVEQWAQKLGERVPDGAALVAVVLVALLVLGVRAWRRRDAGVPAAEKEKEEHAGTEKV